jgi:predicted TIM-barrel fold metal-dependent hydrolase
MSAPAQTKTPQQLKYGFISADDHVVETPDVWTARVPSALKSRAPHLEQQPDGAERWVLDGQVILDGKVANVGALMTDRTKEPTRWADVPAAAYQPAERLKAMNAAGVDYSALYPTVAGVAGQAFAGLTDPELELACVQAYNDWLIDEWSAASERFLPQCIVPVWPPEATVKEIQRCLAKGHKGVVFPAVPMHLRDLPHISGPEFDPVWSACEEAGVPLCLHSGSSPRLQYPPFEGLSPALAEALSAVSRPVSSVFVITLLSFSRVLLRHPNLKVVLGESAHSWGMLYMEWADHQFEHDGLAREGYELKPSEMFHRQCFFTSWFDEVAPYAAHLGIDNILWATNLPLATSTWPRTQEVIERCFQGVTPEDREKVLWRTAAGLYRL